MALNDISLTAGMRNNLISLQSTTTLLNRTQERLSSGKKVNSSLDNPTNFFAAQSHSQRASDLTNRKDGMTEAVQAVRAADKGITAISTLIEAAKGLTQAARSADSTNRAALGTQFNELLAQIDKLASDSGYKGKNFLNNETLDVLFNENGGSKLTIAGFDATATTGLSIAKVITGTVSVTNVVTGTGAATGLVGSGIINLSTHTATINPVSAVTGYHATGTFQVASTTAAATTGQNLFVFDVANVSGIDATAYASLFTGAITVNAITINGVTTAGVLVITGSSGTFTASLTGSALSGATATGAIVSFSITVAAYMATGSSAASAQNLYSFNLATGDIASGLGILTGGPNVYISGTYLADTNYTITGGTLTFNTGFSAPIATGAVTYDYNSGYVSGSATAKSTYTLTYTGVANSASGQVISAVSVGGTLKVNGTDYVLTGSGNVIQFLTGFGPATGAAITYDIQTTTITTGIANGWAAESGIDASVSGLTAAIETLRTKSANLASNLSVVTIRQDFTDGMISTLLKGADNLTLADMNEEGANMLMLQTRQQLGTTSLKMASDAAQSVLRLF